MAAPYTEWRLSTPGGVRHELISQVGSFGEEDADWTQVIRIRAIDLDNFVVECFPPPVFTLTGYVYPRRFFPAGLPALHANRVAAEGWTSGKPIDPFSIDTGAADGTYEEFLRVTITFATAMENDSPDPNDPFTYLEISGSSSGEYLTAPINNSDILWEDAAGAKEAPTEEDQPATQRVNSFEMEWSVRWNQIPFDWYRFTLAPRLRELQGKVNESTMTVLFDAPPETILFLSWTEAQQFTWRDGFAGASPITLDLRFLEKNFQGLSGDELDSSDSSATPAPTSIQVTHNHTWRAGNGWKRLLIGPNENPNFDQGDLNTIFVP